MLYNQFPGPGVIFDGPGNPKEGFVKDMALPYVTRTDSTIARIISAELKRQKDSIVLIPSENYASRAVMEAAGTCLTNKYAEGYPGKRYYNGTHFYDQVETLAIERARRLFGAEHANVQPHSGAQANEAVYQSALAGTSRDYVTFDSWTGIRTRQ